MGKNGRISEYRERLDRTLASLDLTNPDALKTLVQNQLLHSSLNDIEACSEDVIVKRTTEVSSFLNMLRSASVSENAVPKTTETTHGEWKLKDDNEEFRVMYRPGPQGTPFHTLLVEGYVDGTVDACLCISWESNLYKKWWPQLNFPPFKITLCNCLQKVRIGEQISLVRVKVTWPLSTREAVLHYFAFEYLQDGLIVVLLSTISDLDSIDRATHGFTRDGIPGPKDVVRIDLVGGFALQKVTSERSYFRTIANLDMKLDFVPPSLINFISRQLIGTGFRLYQKAVTSLFNCDEDYVKALSDPLYARIREALYSINEPNETTERENLTSDARNKPQEHFIAATQEILRDMEQNVHENDDARDSLNTCKKPFGKIEEETNEEIRLRKDERCMEEKVCGNESVSEILENNAQVTGRKDISEIEEEESEDGGHLEMGDLGIGQPSTSQIARKSFVDRKKNIFISPAVEHALETLDKAIYVVREYRFNSPAMSPSALANEETTNLEKNSEKDSILLKDDVVISNAEGFVDEFRKEGTKERNSHESSNSSSNADIRCVVSIQGSHNRIVPASSEQSLSIPSKSDYAEVSSLKNVIAEVPIMDLNTKPIKQMSIEVNRIHENSRNGGKQMSIEANCIHENTRNGGYKMSQHKTQRCCCFGLSSY